MSYTKLNLKNGTILDESHIEHLENGIVALESDIPTNDEINNLIDAKVADIDGKSAYAYAQEGGFTGTEQEFAEALAKQPELFPVTIYKGEDENYLSSHTGIEIFDAKQAGKIPVALLDSQWLYLVKLENGVAYFSSLSPEGISTIVKVPIINKTATVTTTEFLNSENFSRTMFVIMVDVQDDGTAAILGWYESNSNGGVIGDIHDASTEAIDMSVFAKAYRQGQTVVCIYQGTTLPCTSVGDTDSSMAFNSILYANETDGVMLADVYIEDDGQISSHGWWQYPDSVIPMKINGTSYNGTEEVDFTSTINSMIDAKINALNATGVSY